MEAPLLELNRLTKRFGPQDAVSDITAQLAPGTIGLVGPNGAGKSTLIRLLLGLIEPTSGSARVLGLDIAESPLEIREKVGYMPEHDCLIPAMTGIGFVAYMGQVSGLPKETAVSRAHDVIQFVGLREERYRRISDYSVGMRQRIKLAQALVHDPAVCFLDEPTAGLDPTGRDEMLGLLRQVAAIPGRSLLLSTHLLHDIQGLCDQVLILDAGRRIASGPLDAMLRSGSSETLVRFRGDGPTFVAALRTRGLSPRLNGSEVRVVLPSGGERQIFAAAQESRTQVRFLGRASSTVEDLFVSLVTPPRSGP